MESIIRQLLAGRGQRHAPPVDQGPQRRQNSDWNHVVNPEEMGDTPQHLIMQMMNAKKSSFSRQPNAMDQRQQAIKNKLI